MHNRSSYRQLLLLVNCVLQIHSLYYSSKDKDYLSQSLTHPDSTMFIHTKSRSFHVSQLSKWLWMGTVYNALPLEQGFSTYGLQSIWQTCIYKTILKFIVVAKLSTCLLVDMYTWHYQKCMDFLLKLHNAILRILCLNEYSACFFFFYRSS